MILWMYRRRNNEGISRLANPIGFKGSTPSRAHYFGLKAGPVVIFWKLPAFGEKSHPRLRKAIHLPWKPGHLLQKQGQLLWKNVQNMAGMCPVNQLFTFISKILMLDFFESYCDRMAFETASLQDGVRRMKIENHMVNQTTFACKQYKRQIIGSPPHNSSGARRFS